MTKTVNLCLEEPLTSVLLKTNAKYDWYWGCILGNETGHVVVNLSRVQPLMALTLTLKWPWPWPCVSARACEAPRGKDVGLVDGDRPKECCLWCLCINVATIFDLQTKVTAHFNGRTWEVLLYYTYLSKLVEHVLSPHVVVMSAHS